MGAAVRSRMAPGQTLPAYRYARALEGRKVIEQQFERVLREQGIDAYLAPTTPTTAFAIDVDQDRDESPPMWMSHMYLFNSSRQPAIAVPNGFDEEGLPTSLMIATGQWEDALALQIAHAFQSVTDFHLARPALEVGR
jgi:aspartyl-tRNA(Asn)/glutamyl-tRNA(Gln) amidotransferase subunit A